MHADDATEVWYAIPSAAPDKAQETLPVWRRMGYRVAVLLDGDTPEVPADRTLRVPRYRGWSASVNELIERVVPPSAGIVVTGGDDMLPVPGQPAPALARQFADRFPGLDGVMQPCGDGFGGAGGFCGSPWIGRGFIERAYGGRGPLWPGYFHTHADVELHDVAERTGRLWMRPEIGQHHAHATRDAAAGGGGEVTPGGRADVRRDLELFLRRHLDHFPGSGLPAEGPAPPHRLESHWFRTIGLAGLGGGAFEDEALRLALGGLADRGVERVALCPAGRWLRRAASALADPPVEVVAVADDAAPAAAGRFLGYPRVRPEVLLDGLPGGPPGAVLLCTDTHTAKLHARLGFLAAAGVEVAPLPAAGGPEAAARTGSL
ncbi:hypothetical protein [Phycisphaera mikurensis]|uniref:Uncharacterized protein n=1 Tax=Phycisphaera mikurensis (strain NBRC 102666 / KCTC 22515 / FYK2301M01) TaxID=1142394 RepID=I0IHE7_PHYMF|nr:hypothetical protein [Phycisphaera mikurensis]MBB6440933.1 hypothetical protein [Phycisphaera mikurensis]BAM04685.1 hypothetical protein PSMK_25260 [Phycisphaera mikurensis NBRC 102666]